MKITVLGAAGSVGAPTSFFLAAQGLADEILMIGGRRQNVLKQHAMDISTAVSGLGVKIWAGDYKDMAGSDIVINNAVVDQGFIKDRMEMLPKNLSLAMEIAEKIKRYCPEAIVITVTVPVDPLNYATYKMTGFDRNKVIGYSANDSFRFREMLADHFQVKPGRIDGIAIGEHGNTQVLLFSTAKVDGRSVVIEENVKQRIRAEVPNILKRFEELKSGRTSGWTSAAGLEQLVRAVVHDTGAVIPCSAVLQGEYNQHNLSMSVPVVLGKGGIKKILEYDLAPDEQQGVKITTETLKAAQKVVDECIRLKPF